MAETLITSAESNTNLDGVLGPSASTSGGSLFHRRIEFHLAKKPFTGFSNGGGDFRLETLNPTASDPQRPSGSNQGGGPSAPAGKRPDGLDFSDVALDPELSFGITFRRIGAGLENLGNTCFLNSVLQCLTYTEPLAAYLQSGKHQNSCRHAGFCALCAIQKHVSRALQLTGRSLAPMDLVSNLRCISRNFGNARQEDAHEYMVNLLESMHKCCLPAGVPIESPGAYEKSLVHKIFGGRLRSQVKCMQCSFCSNKFDPFLDLSLEIIKAESLHKALTHFTAKEYLDGGERQYQCQKCKQKVKALKQLTIHKAPYVLTIHLKRFGTHQHGQKIDKPVQFDPTLDLKPFVTGSYDGDLKYTLYGVLVHAGWSTHSGHYYCYVRTSSGMWYSLDDHKVRQVSEKAVLHQKAYMLFYVRDRRNFTPKKHVDVIQKESNVMNAMGNKIDSNSNQGLKEAVKYGPIDKERVNGVDSLAANALKETLMKGAYIQKTDPLMMAERSTLKKEPPLLDVAFKVPVSKDTVKGISDLHPNGEEYLPQSASANGSSDTLNNANKERSTKEDLGGTQKNLSVSVAPTTIIPDSNGHHSYAGDVCITEKTSQKIPAEVSLQVSDKESKKIGPLVLLDRPRCESDQIECLSKESALGASNISSCKEAVDRKCQQKLKKKLPKCQITRMRLGLSILFGASLRLQKKHKKIKRRTLKFNNLSHENLFDRKCSLTDLGPSTSEITGTQTLGGGTIHSRRKASKCGTIQSRRKALKSGSSKKDNIAVTEKIKNFKCGLVEGNLDEKKSNRLSQNGAVLATDKQQEKSCGSPPPSGNQWQAKGTSCLTESRRDSMQNGLTSMLTRSLEETLVASWDGTELPSSQFTESSGLEPVSIGYIGDEWDEEYDRGKRKKVRSSKNAFGGPNPFQEIATKKAKLKKMKMDQLSSGNRPFRI